MFSAIITSNCFYCNSPPVSLFKRRDATVLYNGIDRMGNEGGYTFDNCIPCCRKCNYLKGRFSADGFIRQINAIAVFFLKLTK